MYKLALILLLGCTEKGLPMEPSPARAEDEIVPRTERLRAFVTGERSKRHDAFQKLKGREGIYAELTPTSNEYVQAIVEELAYDACATSEEDLALTSCREGRLPGPDRPPNSTPETCMEEWRDGKHWVSPTQWVHRDGYMARCQAEGEKARTAIEASQESLRQNLDAARRLAASSTR